MQSGYEHKTDPGSPKGKPLHRSQESYSIANSRSLSVISEAKEPETAMKELVKKHWSNCWPLKCCKRSAKVIPSLRNTPSTLRIS